MCYCLCFTILLKQWIERVGQSSNSLVHAQIMSLSYVFLSSSQYLLLSFSSLSVNFFITKSAFF